MQQVSYSVCSVVHDVDSRELTTTKYWYLVINVCCVVNLVDCLWEETETVSLLLERGVASWKAEVVKWDLRSKVKLICFVDTLMTLTSVNIKPALLFSLLEQAQALARSIMLTIHEGWACDCVLWGINMPALSPWGKKSWTHRWTFLFQTPTIFPS